ncbi:MAG: hypothetical protein AUK51_11395 [Comamonadaceae bacterium CG2_30_59_20]|nr:MAG: hypothetical protein AUK51_11395 [Comamonadaceae bacterium CG2_30_59_20]
MNFQQTLIRALVSDYWVLNRVLDKNHRNSLKVGNSVAPIFELLFKQNNINYTIHQITSSYYEVTLADDDLHDFELYLYTIKSIREDHLIQEPEIENEDIVRDYLKQIEIFFSPNSNYKIAIPLGSLDIPDYPKNTYFYMICNLHNQTALLGDINDFNID